MSKEEYISQYTYLGKTIKECEQGKKQFKAFLYRLKEEGWLV